MSKLPRQTRVGECAERLGELRLLDVFVADDEALEERLVPLAASLRWRLRVGGLAVGEQVERLVERRLDVLERLLGERELCLRLPDLGGEAVLLGAQELERHGALVVGVQELRVRWSSSPASRRRWRADSCSASWRMPVRAWSSFARTASM
jgi:hypothetical protein